MVRYREYSYPSGSGVSKGPSSSVTYTRYPTKGSCTDNDHGWGSNNTLDVVHNYVEPFVGITGKAYNASGSLIREFENCPPLSQTSVTHEGTPNYSFSRSVASGANSSHPGEPVIEIPNFIYELKDVPSMLKKHAEVAIELEELAHKHGARSIGEYMANPKNPSKDWLAFNFSWKPLVADLEALGSINEYARRRNRQLSADFGVTNTRAELGENKSHGSDSGYYIHSSTFPSRRVSEHTTRKWCVYNWICNYAPIVALESRGLATLANALGVDLNMKHAWNALPWSWLVDWFIGVDEIIGAHSNRFGWYLAGCSTMTHTISRTDNTEACSFDPKIEFPPFSQHTERKQRNGALPSISVKPVANFFKPDHLATLASLKVMGKF